MNENLIPYVPSKSLRSTHEETPLENQELAKKPPPPPRVVPYTTRDVRFLYWCAKVLNWFGRILIWVSQVMFRQVPRGHKFLAAHIFGPVTFKTYYRRSNFCRECPELERRTIGSGFEICKAENCGCGTWKLANLKHKRRLSGYKCVRGLFGYGFLARCWYRLFPIPAPKQKPCQNKK